MNMKKDLSINSVTEEAMKNTKPHVRAAHMEYRQSRNTTLYNTGGHF